MILLTTSRRPNRQTRLLARELSRVLPGARYLPRGSKSVRDLFFLARRFGLRAVAVVESREGLPSLLRIMLPGGEAWEEMEIRLTGYRLWTRKVSLSPTRIEPIPGGEEFARELSRFISLPVGAAGGEPAVFVGRGEVFFGDGSGKAGPELMVSGWRLLHAGAREA